MLEQSALEAHDGIVRQHDAQSEVFSVIYLEASVRVQTMAYEANRWEEMMHTFWQRLACARVSMNERFHRSGLIAEHELQWVALGVAHTKALRRLKWAMAEAERKEREAAEAQLREEAERCPPPENETEEGEGGREMGGAPPPPPSTTVDVGNALS